MVILKAITSLLIPLVMLIQGLTWSLRSRDSSTGFAGKDQDAALKMGPGLQDSQFYKPGANWKFATRIVTARSIKGEIKARCS